MGRRAVVRYGGVVGVWVMIDGMEKGILGHWLKSWSRARD